MKLPHLFSKEVPTMEQKKRKLNVIDIIAICAVVIGIISVLVRLAAGDDIDLPSHTEEETYRVTFFAECVPGAVADTLSIGDAGINGSRNMDIGTLVEFTVGDAIIYTTNAAGEMVKTTKEDYCSVSLTFELSGAQEPTGLLVGDYHLNVGYYINLFVGNTYLSTYVTAIAPGPVTCQ